MSRAPINAFRQNLKNAVGIAAAQGVAITPANLAYGAYTSLGLVWPANAGDGYGFWLVLSNGGTSAAARDILIKVGIDRSGGASYIDWIVDVPASSAGPYDGAGGNGIWYWIPMLVPEGSNIAVAAAVNNATVGTLSAYCRVRLKPINPMSLRLGTYARTYGSNGPTNLTTYGTAITPVSGSDSAYVQLGTVAAGDDIWFWLLGITINNAASNNNGQVWDLAIGDGVNNLDVIDDMVVQPNAAETNNYVCAGEFYPAAPGDKIYSRARGNGVSPTGMGAIGIGIGG